MTYVYNPGEPPCHDVTVATADDGMQVLLVDGVPIADSRTVDVHELGLGLMQIYGGGMSHLPIRGSLIPSMMPSLRPPGACMADPIPF